MASSHQEQVVSRFASLLGTKRNKEVLSSTLRAADTGEAALRELVLCFSKTVENHHVVCTLPSLDMRKIEDQMGSNPLPNLGEHRATVSKLYAANRDFVPAMEASVLGVSNAADASAEAAQVEQKAAQSLGSLTSWTKSSFAYAPGAVSKNVSDSFSSLVNSRVQAWTILLLRHSLTTGDSTSRSRLLNMLSCSIKVISGQTTFKALALPKAAMGHAKDADVILPLLFEVELKVSIQSKDDSVTVRAPGTISGKPYWIDLFFSAFSLSHVRRAANFDKDETGSLTSVDIALDTGVMLDSMVQQARMVVFKAVAKATSSGQLLPSLDGDMDPSSARGKSEVAPTLSGSSHKPPNPNEKSLPHSLLQQKSRASALKLNSVLQGSSDTKQVSSNATFSKGKQTKSVQWDHDAVMAKAKPATNPSPKRQRLSNKEAKLRSFKSFGRAHAGDFGSGPRNATFGDFGRKPIWGRNGKMANAPTPIQPNYEHSQDLMSTAPKSPKNATFDLQRPTVRVSSDVLGSLRKNKTQNNSGSTAIPRTATAHENWLVRKTLGNTSNDFH